MPSEIDVVKLQLAMAFGQGAGAMLANGEALETLLAEEGEVIANALTNWSASRWAFTELVRTLGQLSAVHAAANGSAEIRWADIAPSIAPVLVVEEERPPSVAECRCSQVSARAIRPPKSWPTKESGC